VKIVTGTTTVLALSIFLQVANHAHAASQDFDFKDPKGVNSISFLLDSPLEPILGLTAGITGTIKFDETDPKSTVGKIEIDGKSLHIENKGMKDTLHGPDWLDVAKNPKIEFAFKQVKDAKTVEPNVFELSVVGELTCKGIKKEITVPVRASFLPNKLGERMRDAKGDLLVLRSKFTIKRKDFDIKPTMGNDVVSEDIQVTVSIVGASPKK
jgi:polyisoprenoid-binding protein YceI